MLSSLQTATWHWFQGTARVTQLHRNPTDGEAHSHAESTDGQKLWLASSGTQSHPLLQERQFKRRAAGRPSSPGVTAQWAWTLGKERAPQQVTSRMPSTAQLQCGAASFVNMAQSPGSSIAPLPHQHFSIQPRDMAGPFWQTCPPQLSHYTGKQDASQDTAVNATLTDWWKH